MRPLLLMMFGSNIAEIRTETVKLSAYWARPVSSSSASFFALLVGNKGQRESRGISNEARGTKERRKKRGEAPAKSCLFLLPAFVCAQIYIERETSENESGLDQTIWDELFQGRLNSTNRIIQIVYLVDSNSPANSFIASLRWPILKDVCDIQ